MHGISVALCEHGARLMSVHALRPAPTSHMMHLLQGTADLLHHFRKGASQSAIHCQIIGSVVVVQAGFRHYNNASNAQDATSTHWPILSVDVPMQFFLVWESHEELLRQALCDQSEVQTTGKHTGACQTQACSWKQHAKQQAKVDAVPDLLTLEQPAG